MRKTRFPILVIATFCYITTSFFVQCKVDKVKEKNQIQPFSNIPEPDASNNIWIKKINSIDVPNGYERTVSSPNSFAFYLQHLSLKKDKTVYLYNGEKKRNQNAQFAVIDMPIGKQDLQQCADAVMRLRAEFLYAKGDYDNIVFKDNDGKIYKLAQGSSRKQFDSYLNVVFGMCGSYSLSMQLKPKPMQDMQIGDVLIHGGFPGHAVIVVDMAENVNTKQKIFILAQSYMPAQDIQVLRSAYNTQTPWVNLDSSNKIYTPEYLFYNNELKTW